MRLLVAYWFASVLVFPKTSTAKFDAVPLSDRIIVAQGGLPALKQQDEHGYDTRVFKHRDADETGPVRKVAASLAQPLEPIRQSRKLSSASRSAIAVVIRSIIVSVVSSGCMFGNSGE